MAVNKVKLSNGETLIDISGDTVTPETLAEGVTAHNKSGERIVGTMSSVNCKIYRVSVPTAVASTDVIVVSGDADVAAHRADENAMVTVRKVTNNNTIGIAMIVETNHLLPLTYGFYANYNKTANGCATINSSCTGLTFEGTSSSTPYIKCTPNGDIIVHPQRTNNNFGGAEYIVTFSW